MSDGKGRSTMQVVVTTYFPMFIAALSLCTSIYNGYLNNKFVDLIQNNTARVETLRTCKEVIEAYFQVKFRVGQISASAERAGAGNSAGAGPAAVASAEQMEATNAVGKVGALGTYLANLRDDAAREHYTQLTEQLEQVVSKAATTPRANLDKLFESADRTFKIMNDDCVRSAKNALK